MENRIRVSCGDTHGYHMIPELFKKLEHCDVYHVGDFGIGFIGKDQTIKNLNTLNKFLKEKDIRLFIGRGNHDNPIYWQSEIYRTENIWFVPDYTIVDETLFLGGAISIDRIYRIAKKAGWWPDEIFTYNPIVKTMTGVKDVISHNRPQFCKPLVLSKMVLKFCEEDPTLKSMLIEERELLTQVYSELTINNSINNWISGHMHSSGTEYFDNTIFSYLGINELKEF